MKKYICTNNKDETPIDIYFPDKSDEKMLFEMFSYLGIDFVKNLKYWEQIIHNKEFLLQLFLQHVRLTPKDLSKNIGIPYAWFISDRLKMLDFQNQIEFIYSEWKNPRYKKEYESCTLHYI